MSLSMANAVSLVKPGLFPTKADEPRIDPHPRRTNPGSTASEEGETMAPQFPPKAGDRRTDHHPRRTHPGSTPTQGGRTPDRPPARRGRRWRRSLRQLFVTDRLWMVAERRILTYGSGREFILDIVVINSM